MDRGAWPTTVHRVTKSQKRLKQLSTAQHIHLPGLPGWHSGKESTCQFRRYRRRRFKPWVRRIPWQKKMATHSSICAWEIPWTKEPGGLQFMVSQIVRHDLVTRQQAERVPGKDITVAANFSPLFQPYPFPPFLHKPRLISVSFPIPTLP